MTESNDKGLQSVPTTDAELTEQVDLLADRINELQEEREQRAERIDELEEDYVPTAIVRKVLHEYGVPAGKVDTFVETMEEVDEKYGDDDV